jgi:hypothetical protein
MKVPFVQFGSDDYGTEVVIQKGETLEDAIKRADEVIVALMETTCADLVVEFVKKHPAKFKGKLVDAKVANALYTENQQLKAQKETVKSPLDEEVESLNKPRE